MLLRVSVWSVLKAITEINVKKRVDAALVKFVKRILAIVSMVARMDGLGVIVSRCAIRIVQNVRQKTNAWCAFPGLLEAVVTSSVQKSVPHVPKI